MLHSLAWMSGMSRKMLFLLASPHCLGTFQAVGSLLIDRSTCVFAEVFWSGVDSVCGVCS